MKRSRLLALALAAAALTASGCSGTHAALGFDSRAEVKLTSPNISDFHLIVSPRES